MTTTTTATNRTWPNYLYKYRYLPLLNARLANNHHPTRPMIPLHPISLSSKYFFRLTPPPELLNTLPATSMEIQKLSSFLASSLMTVQNLEDILGNVNDPGSAALFYTHHRFVAVATRRAAPPQREHTTLCVVWHRGAAVTNNTKPPSTLQSYKRATVLCRL